MAQTEEKQKARLHSLRHKRLQMHPCRCDCSKQHCTSTESYVCICLRELSWYKHVSGCVAKILEKISDRPGGLHGHIAQIPPLCEKASFKKVKYVSYPTHKGRATSNLPSSTGSIRRPTQFTKAGLVQGYPLYQTIILRVWRILLHLALVVENGLLLQVIQHLNELWRTVGTTSLSAKDRRGVRCLLVDVTIPILCGTAASGHNTQAQQPKHLSKPQKTRGLLGLTFSKHPLGNNERGTSPVGCLVARSMVMASPESCHGVCDCGCIRIQLLQP